MGKVDPSKSIPPDEISMSGILVPDDFLAQRDLSLPAKIIYLLVKRELQSKRRTFTTKLTDTKLSKLTGISKSTIQRKLTELDTKGYIAIVSQNRATEKDAKGIVKEIRGTRWIYLDKKLAGYRRRAINQSKRPVEALYSILVLERRMSSAAYVRAMKSAAKEERELLEKEEEEQYLDAFRESLADVPDDLLPELEKEAGEEPGTYLKMKQEFIDEQVALDESDDGLFDEVEP